MGHPQIYIIGAGVNGLSCGIRLLQAGYPVHILAREQSPHTTSDKAAAIWYPYQAYPQERVLAWGAVSLKVLYELLDEPAAGVSLVELIELLPEPNPEPWWATAVPTWQLSHSTDFPTGYTSAYQLTVPVMDTSRYIPYLHHWYERLGGQITTTTVADFATVDPAARLIINCAGLGARELAEDAAVYPIRGQIIRVRAPEVRRAFIADVGPLAVGYVIPRGEDCVLGGTAERGAEELQPDPATAELIWHKATQLDPRLATAEIITHLVGLRPGRPTVRLESDHTADGRPLIHNYGHGGAGLTLSWGCAAEVVALVAAIL